MGDTELFAYCGQQLTNISNGLPISDLSDYSRLLDSLQELRYVILSHRNDQVPINRLPVEILMLICELTLPPDPELTPPGNKRVFCVTKLTHVCRRWRLVLISSPPLWTNFHVVKAAPKFVAECLQRSGTSLTHVSFEWDANDPDYKTPSTSVADDDGSVVDNDGDVVDEDDTGQISSNEPDNTDYRTASHSTFSIYPDHRDSHYSWTAYIKEAQGYHSLMQHSHRIATLDIFLSAPEDNGDGEGDNPLACGLLLYPFPALQTLKLRCPLGRHGPIPGVILDEHIPVVKSLFLENIRPTQILDFSLNMTSLNLTTGLSTSIDTGLFLRFLEKNHNLQSLTLNNYKFPPLPESIAPVALNDLRKLVVSSESVTFLRHLAALPLGPQSYFRMERACPRLLLSANNSATGTSTSVSTFSPGVDPDVDELLSMISGVFGSGWEEASQVVVVFPIGGWEQEFVDRFLGCLTRLDDLSIVCKHDCVDPWFDSLTASKDRCPKLRRVRLDIAPEYCSRALRSVRKLVKRRAEDGIPLEVVEQIGVSPPAVGVWNDLYDRWQIKDYLTAEDS